MATKKPAAKKTTTAAKKTTTRITTTASAAIDAPPLSQPILASSVPSVPASYQPLTKKQSAGLKKPAPAQSASVAGAAAEITASTTWVKDFSANAPSAASFAAALENAETATVAAQAADVWAQYANTQKQLAWNEALTLEAQFQDEWAYAVSHDPSILTRYPDLATFVNAKKSQAQKAADRRKAAKRKAAKGKT